MIQKILVIVLLIAAVAYLGYRAYKKITKKKDCGDGNCGCQ